MVIRHKPEAATHFSPLNLCSNDRQAQVVYSSYVNLHTDP